jgi:hypothetical protein
MPDGRGRALEIGGSLTHRLDLSDEPFALSLGYS